MGAGSLALFAALSDNIIEKTLKRNEAWLRDFQGFSAGHLRKLIERTRKQGFAFIEGGVVPGMNAIVPLVALSIAAINDRMSAKRISELVDLLDAERRSLATMMRAPRRAAE